MQALREILKTTALPRYLTVSAGTALVYFGAIYLLHDHLGLGPTPAFSAAYVLGLGAHFLGNKLFAFRSLDIDPTPGEIARYALLLGINYAITYGFVQAALYWLGSLYWGTILAPPATFVVSYPFLKYVVFRAGPRSALPPDKEKAGDVSASGSD